MKKKLITYILTFLVCYLHSQTTKTCVKIDFEKLPNNEKLVEGLVIDKQYFNEFGVSFELENGAKPVLAKVGSPTTAFSSDLGGDTPMPNQNIGSFFITDDGKISNLTAIPLIVRFNNPLDSISAVVLDMDFDEIFTVDARDKNDKIIFTKTVKAGEKDTGDGIATVFGFNLEGCEGAIYSLKFKGTREVAGGFGFAMDNFSFCFSGIDIQKEIGLFVSPTNCITNKGYIQIVNNGKKNYKYSLDGSPLIGLDSISFSTFGKHTIFITDENGCQAEFDIFIDNPPPILINSKNISNTNCGEENGSIIVNASGDDLQYSLNQNPFKKINTFDGLSPETYKVIIKDRYECKDSFETKILPSPKVFVDDIIKTKDFCEDTSGTVSLTMNPKGDYVFLLKENKVSNTSGFFDNLSKGKYNLNIDNNNGCIIDTIITIEYTPSVKFDFKTTLSDCLDNTGSIIISSLNNNEELSMFFGDLKKDTNIINNLGYGNYTIYGVDKYGCENRSIINVERNNCPIYLPNIIYQGSFNGNNKFILKTIEGYTPGIIRYRIYDRWGNLIYKKENFDLWSEEYWWDGTFNGQYVENGVYVYLIEVRHPNDTIEVLSGDLTFLRDR